jgi:putative isomerase
LQTGRHAGALDAVRDVIGWNTVWDGANRRPYTSLSRNWVAQKFGGWGVWLNDVLYHGLMAGLFDTEIARENLAAVFAGATPYGNLPCLLTGRDSWVDRSQPPIGAFIAWMLYLRTRDTLILSESYAVLARNHDWWWQTRDGNGDGLVEYGTSPVGEGLYRGPKLAAKDESSMDNSPTHDEATLRTDVWTLDCADVGLNSLLALDGEMLANMARALGSESEAERFGSRAESLKARIRERLWDSERRVFANRLWSGKFTASLAPTSFYPLIAGAASEAQARALLPLLTDVAKFGGTWRLPSCTRDDPAFPTTSIGAAASGRRSTSRSGMASSATASTPRRPTSPITAIACSRANGRAATAPRTTMPSPARPSTSPTPTRSTAGAPSCPPWQSAKSPTSIPGTAGRSRTVPATAWWARCSRPRGLPSFNPSRPG